MAMIKESDAATKLCHFARAVSDPATEGWSGTISGDDVAVTGVNRKFGNTGHPACMCITRKCMAWIPMETVGFCSAFDDNRN